MPESESLKLVTAHTHTAKLRVFSTPSSPSFSQIVDQCFCSPIEAFTQTRYVSADDAWRNVKTFPNGSTQESFANQGQGVFMVDDDEKALVRIGPYRRSPNPESIRQSPKYLRTEQLLGYEAYVLKEDGPGITAEVYFAADLNGDVIKQVVSKPGSTMTLEPVSITLGEPAATNLQHESYPVVKTAHLNNGVRSGQYRVKNSNRTASQ